MSFMTAGSIKLRDPLKDPLSAIGGKSQGRLQDIIGRVTNRSRESQIASGRPMGEYTGQAVGDAGTLASRGVDDSLYGVIGDASYKQNVADRDHLRKMALAKKLGKMSSPSTLDEIIGGVGSLGSIIPAGRSLYNRIPRGGGGSNPLTMGAYSGVNNMMSAYDPFEELLMTRGA